MIIGEKDVLFHNKEEKYKYQDLHQSGGHDTSWCDDIDILEKEFYQGTRCKAYWISGASIKSKYNMHGF